MSATAPLQRLSCSTAEETTGNGLRRRRPRKWESLEAREKEFSRIERELGIAGADAWREVTAATVIAKCGRALLQHYGNSLTALLRDLRPEAMAGGEGATRVRVSRGYWEDEERAREFLQSLAREHHIGRIEDWRRVTTAAMVEAGGKALLRRHGGKLGLLQWAYSTPGVLLSPRHSRQTSDEVHSSCDQKGEKERASVNVLERSLEERLRLTMTKRVPHYWKDSSNRRAFLEEFMRERKIVKDEDWSGVTAKNIASAGGAGLLAMYSGSIVKMLQSELPERELTADKLRRNVPRRHWDSAENRREALERLALRCGIEEPQQWKSLTARDFHALGLSSLLQRYNGSVALMLTDVYGPTASGATAIRHNKRRGHWSCADNRKLFFDDVARRHGLDGSPESWQTLTGKDVIAAGGKGLLYRYSDSLLAALEDTYGSDFGDACKSRRVVRHRYWGDEKRVKAFVKNLEESLSISTPEEWTRVSREQILQHTGGSSLLRAVTLPGALSIVYPDRNWDVELPAFAGGKKACQRGLFIAVATVFGAVEAA